MSHRRMTVFFDGHEILSLDDEVKKARAKDVLTQNPPAKQYHLHDELLKIFCFDCNRLVCRDSIVKDHRDHDIVFKPCGCYKQEERAYGEPEASERNGSQSVSCCG